MSCSISELAVQFGPRNGLVGILTSPVGETRTEAPAIIILNTGIIHRVGHHRMFVTMSRKLAACGYTVFRFDFSGIGDSQARAEALSPLASSLADIKDSIDWLVQNRAMPKSVLVGLCSGADYALIYGHNDPRVAGMVLIDPAVPVTIRAYLHHVVTRLARPRSWANLLIGKSGIVRTFLQQAKRQLPRRVEGAHIGLEDLPFHPLLIESYRNSIENGINIVTILTRDHAQSGHTQIEDILPGIPIRGQIRLVVFRDSDHVFTELAHRDRLTRLIADWMEEVVQ